MGKFGFREQAQLSQTGTWGKMQGDGHFWATEHIRDPEPVELIHPVIRSKLMQQVPSRELSVLSISKFLRAS